MDAGGPSIYMAKKLWSKSATRLHPTVERYTVGDDYILDRELLPFDIEGTRVHVAGLKRIGILTVAEERRIRSALSILARRAKRGQVEIRVEDEDCHTVIEAFLTKRLGDIGKKVHTGRSRNDQVLTAMRLFMRASLDGLHADVLDLASCFLKKAEKTKDIPMPGYSHTQQAMISSVGHYLASFVESLLDDLEFLLVARRQINVSPLGSAAGFGVSLPLPREANAKSLRFERVQLNSLYCQTSRGKFESIYLEVLSQIMITLGRFANDLVWMTSQEFQFFSVPANLLTGSSIMPQKKNYDAMELLRGDVAVVASAQHTVKNLLKGLPSGYNRDLQLMKGLVINSAHRVAEALRVTRLFIDGLTVNRKRLSEVIEPGLFAAEVALSLVKRGIPFRDAYQQAMSELAQTPCKPVESLKQTRSLGSPGNLRLPLYKQRLKRLSRSLR